MLQQLVTCMETLAEADRETDALEKQIAAQHGSLHGRIPI